MIALTVLSIMICIGGSVLYDLQPAFMGVVATLAIFIILVTLMILRRCALQGKFFRRFLRLDRFGSLVIPVCCLGLASSIISSIVGSVS